MKEVKKGESEGNNFYLTIVDSIKSSSKLPSMPISKQCLNYYIRKLKSLGIIKKIGYGVWVLGPNKDYSQLTKQVKINTLGKGKHSDIFTSKSNIRGHGFIITFKLPKIENWYRREDYLRKNAINYQNLRNNVQSIYFREHKIWLTNKSIVIYSPKGKSYFSDSAKLSKSYAIYDIIQLLKGVERLLNANLQIKGEYIFKVSRQHYARVHDDLAIHYNRNGEKISVSDHNGEWLKTDLSFNIDELETVHKDTADIDSDHVISPFFNDIKHHFEATGEPIKISSLIFAINGLVKNQEYHAENIRSHIAAIQSLAKGMEEFNKNMATLFEILKRRG